jgi:membrane-associated protease RseP (regulator of RpoE activity)
MHRRGEPHFDWEIEAMKYWNHIAKLAAKYAASIAIAVLLACPAAAQSEEEIIIHEAAERDAEVDRRMIEAERRMAEAAREMAKLTSERIPHIERIERRVEFMGRPRLGVTISGDDQKGPVEGVNIVGVTPGSAASDAGLRAGDVITSINTESISASSAAEANQKLLDFMSGVSEGDALDVEYLRNGKIGKVEVIPQVFETNVFVWDGIGDPDFDIQMVPGVPGIRGVVRVPGTQNFSLFHSGNGLGDMELVELNEGLGRYFGTDSGLLVVSAPESNSLQLQDGDVIQSIGGREPNSVRHGLQILGSYQAGEKLEIMIMRDKKSKKLNIEMPDGRSSMLFENIIESVRPVMLPVPASAPEPVIAIERT